MVVSFRYFQLLKVFAALDSKHWRKRRDALRAELLFVEGLGKGLRPSRGHGTDAAVNQY
jgi:hypothetical protein